VLHLHVIVVIVNAYRVSRWPLFLLTYGPSWRFAFLPDSLTFRHDKLEPR